MRALQPLEAILPPGNADVALRFYDSAPSGKSRMVARILMLNRNSWGRFAKPFSVKNSGEHFELSSFKKFL